jgi:hypothetical protein
VKQCLQIADAGGAAESPPAPAGHVVATLWYPRIAIYL